MDALFALLMAFIVAGISRPCFRTTRQCYAREFISPVRLAASIFPWPCRRTFLLLRARPVESALLAAVYGPPAALPNLPTRPSWPRPPSPSLFVRLSKLPIYCAREHTIRGRTCSCHGTNARINVAPDKWYHHMPCPLYHGPSVHFVCLDFWRPLQVVLVKREDAAEPATIATTSSCTCSGPSFPNITQLICRPSTAQAVSVPRARQLQ